jgi:hypothetical protein
MVYFKYIIFFLFGYYCIGFFVIEYWKDKLWDYNAKDKR